MIYNIRNRYTKDVQVSVEINCDEDDSNAIKLGLAIKAALAKGENLCEADLRGAHLSWASFDEADLYGAAFRGAGLYGAKFRGTKGAENIIAQTRILPEGSIIGWKKCKNNVIVKLRVPEEAKRSHAFGRTCRAEFVDVLEVFGAEYGVSTYDSKVEYRVGERVYPDSFSDDWTAECESGIHFFITREEAENY